MKEAMEAISYKVKSILHGLPSHIDFLCKLWLIMININLILILSSRIAKPDSHVNYNLMEISHLQNEFYKVAKLCLFIFKYSWCIVKNTI
jgi:hypothetical protein